VYQFFGTKLADQRKDWVAELKQVSEDFTRRTTNIIHHGRFLDNEAEKLNGRCDGITKKLDRLDDLSCQTAEDHKQLFKRVN
jgi:hypothetical protein